jgi:glycosyltransferase involved in cell wall biosynthesis
MIYLNPEVVSGLGEDTFWTWFKREFPSASFTVPKRLQFEDVLLQYSTLGFPRIPGKTVALLWELYPEMREVFNVTTWDARIDKVYDCAKFCTHRTVSSPLAAKYYTEYGSADVLPIGVNTDLFKPGKDKDALRKKFGLPPDREIGFWGGTTHPMKGYSRLLEYAKSHPDIYWIVVWKWDMEADNFPGGHNYVKISQEMISDLMNCADFILFTGLLRSYFMLEWEAMACDLPVRLFDPLLERDFIPSNNPRDDVFRNKWDRKSAKTLWSTYLEKKGVTW